ncbi:hypothetical protein IMY05_C4491000500 [Salix suchowensis]|nr:hypothetical protein IMY05_C4491000500 [Salix suchowensis]
MLREQYQLVVFLLTPAIPLALIHLLPQQPHFFWAIACFPYRIIQTRYGQRKHSPYQIWHPPTPITQHSTPQGGLQPLNGASEGQKPPSATRLAPSSSPAVVPNIANESPVMGNTGSFFILRVPPCDLAPSRQILPGISPRMFPHLPLPDLQRIPPFSLGREQRRFSPTTFAILLRVQTKPDSSPETIVQSSSVDKKGSSTESVHISAALPHTSTSKDSRNTHAAPSQLLSHTAPNAYPSSRPNGTRTVTFAQPHETTSSQRHKDTPTYPMSTQHSAGKDAQISEFGSIKHLCMTTQSSTERILNHHQLKPDPSTLAFATSCVYYSSPRNKHASGGSLSTPATAPSFTLPPADSVYDSTYRSRHRHEHRPLPSTQSRYTSTMTLRNPAPPLAAPLVALPTAPPAATEQRGLLSDPTRHYGAPRPADRMCEKAPPRDSRSTQPTDPRQGQTTPVARIQNQRLAELLSSPVPTSTDKIVNAPHGYVQPTLAPETRKEATRAADMPPPRAPYLQESRSVREDHTSHTVPAQSDHLRRRTSAQRLPSANSAPAFPVPVVGGSAPQQPTLGDSAHPSSQSHRNAPANLSKFHSQWSNSSAMATDGSQNTVTKSRTSPPQRTPQIPRGIPALRQHPPRNLFLPHLRQPRIHKYLRPVVTLRYADGSNGTQKANVVAASHAGEIINPALQQYTTNPGTAPSGSVPTQPSRSHRAVEQPGYPTAYTSNNGASHHRSRSSVIYNNVPPTLVRPQHHHSSSMPVSVHPDDHATMPPMTRAYNSYPHPTTQPTSTSQVSASQSTQHATTQQIAVPSGANLASHANGNVTRTALPGL